MAHDIQYGIGIEIRDINSAWLIFYCFQQNEGEVTDILACEAARIPLDIFTDIKKETVLQREDGQITEMVIKYRRIDEYLSFEAIVTGPTGVEELQALDFLFGQYSIKDNSIDKEILDVGTLREDHHSKGGNAVAVGLEVSGVVVRKILRTSGSYTGQLIRFLGRKFTEVTVDPSKSAPIEEIDPQLLLEAQRRKEWAERVNSGARTLTSTILYPVRWTGQKAAKLAAVEGSTDQRMEMREKQRPKSKLNRAMWDTVEGMGNGLTSVFKGVTEAIAEVGNAIGDSAMHHSKAKYGEHYANQVTKSYVDAASEIGLAGYKVANVFSFGIAGLMIDVVVEGTTLLVSLYDYLVGPIILQGYMTLV